MRIEMRLLRCFSNCAVILLLSACAYNNGVTGVAAGSNPDQEYPTAWREIVTVADRERLQHWRDAFTEGLDEARAGGREGEIAGFGPLLVRDAGLSQPRPPSGDYRCRVVKLGAQGTGTMPLVAHEWFDCTVAADGEVLRFAKTSGSQRPVGSIYADNRTRMVFLGTLQLGDEQATFSYASDSERDLVGAVERIGEQRWRIVFPYPRFESLVDVMELVPAG